MGDRTPYQTLGLSEEASFEDIQAVKAQLVEESQGDPQRIDEVEAAYDAIIMERLRLRQEGKIKVPEKIRFPERQEEAPPVRVPPLKVPSPPSWLQGSWTVPPREEWLWPTGIFAALVAVSWVNPQGNSLQSLLLVAGVFATLALLNRKRGSLGKALLWCLGALILGTGIGALLPMAGLTLAPALVDKIAATVTFVLLWLISVLVI